MAKADDDFIQLARDRWKQAQDADEQQSKRELEDLKFYAGDQWDALQKQAREGQPANANLGLPPVPARPTFVINKVREPVRQVLNAEEQAEFGYEIVAAGDFEGLTDGPSPELEAEIELREGLIRRIQRTSEAQDASSWAASRAAIAGRGFSGVTTRYVEGETFDQDIVVYRIFNQNAVALDPAHQEPDGSDADWGFHGVDMPIDQYEAEFGKKNSHKVETNRVVAASYSDSEWRKLGDEAPGWFTSEGKTKSVRVMNYYYTVRTTRTLCQMPDGSTGYEDELVESAPKPIQTRPDIKKQVKWAKIDGVQKLDETDWAGRYIPIVKYLGEELHPYDNERRAEGMVRPARDSGKGFNAMASKLTEVVGLAPIPPLMAAEGTWEKYKEWYQLANTRTLPVLPYDTVDLRGNPAPPPFRTPADVPIQPIAIALQMFDEAIKSTTGVPDTQLGNQDPNVKSGKMAQALIEQSQHGTSHYLKNMIRSKRHEAQIVNDLLYAIYGTRPGRLARIVDGENEPQTVRIDSPKEPQTQTGVLPGTNQTPQAPPKTYTLSKDISFDVALKVTKNSGTRREQESQILGALIEARPELLGWFGDVFFKNQDGPGHAEMADRAKVMLVPPIQQLLAQKAQGGPEIPPAIMQQMAQMKQQLEDAHSLLQKAAGELQSKQMEYQSKEKIAGQDREADLEKERMRNATQLAVAKLNILGKGVIAQGEAEDEQIALHTELTHDATQADLDRQHQAQQAQAAQAHQMATGAAQAGVSAEQQAAQQAHEAEQAQAAQAAQQQEPSA